MTRRKRTSREDARRLFLSGEMTTNSEIAAQLGVKPHTVGRWRKYEDWDGLRLKIDRRAAEMFVEKIATDRTQLNVLHFRFWELLLTRSMEGLKAQAQLDLRDIERYSAILEKAQKGQRLAKGLSLSGEAEEQIRAQAEAEIRSLIDAFIDTVKVNVPDEETRDRIRRGLLQAVPDDSEALDGAEGGP